MFQDEPSALDRELQFLEQHNSDSFNLFTNKHHVTGGTRDRHNVDLDDHTSVYSWRSSERTQAASKKAESARFASRSSRTAQTPMTPRKLSATRASSTRRPRTKTRSDSATFNANNTSNIYQNAQQRSANGGKSRGGRSRSLPRRKSAKQSDARMREKENIYGNLSTSRFLAQQQH